MVVASPEVELSRKPVAAKMAAHVLEPNRLGHLVRTSRRGRRRRSKLPHGWLAPP